jgi:A/G-specific adenine glycosylase
MPIEPLAEQLLDWFAHNARDLPWRRTYHPYHIWISEIMLQQTQMDRVIGFFTRWMRLFPDIPQLAAADDTGVLKAWEGLGYYTRARNIIRTADILTTRYHATLPSDYRSLLELPGIGPYTAGAILSLAFNQPYPAIDANVERVFARIFNREGSLKNAHNREFIRTKALALMPAGCARHFNQAVMEFGALICRPSSPLCEQCPLTQLCACHHLGTAAQRPQAATSKEIITIEMATGILVRNGRIFIQQRPARGVWAGLWEFPGGRLEPGETPEEALVREYREETELTVRPLYSITATQHSYMNYRVTLHGFLCRLQGKNPTVGLHAAQQYRWAGWQELSRYPFPAGHRKLIDYINDCPEILSSLN